MYTKSYSRLQVMIEEKEELKGEELPEDELLPAELDLLPLEQETDKVLHEIVKAETVDELKGYTAKFNLNMAKKNAIRIAKLQNLLDSVNDQAIERFTKYPSEFSNKEVLDYMKAVQEQINSSQQALEEAGDKPMIQITDKHSEVNINVENPALGTRESKERVINAVQALMQYMTTAPQNEVIEEEELYNNMEDKPDGE